MKIKYKRKLSVLLILMIAVLLGILVMALYWSVFDKSEKSAKVTIAIMQDDRVQDYNTNYYKTWLEKRTGYQIQFVYIQPNYYKEYIRALVEAKEGTIDAIFLPAGREIMTDEEFQRYVKAGRFANIMDYADADSNLQKLFDNYQNIQLREKVSEPDGSIYYMPNMDTSRKTRNFQVLWMNVKWLKQLELNIPQTTQELYETLKAFKNLDPNGNGIQDEIPLISCEDEYKLQSYNFLLNSFIPNDPIRGRAFYDSTGKAVLAPCQEEFRTGLKFCRKLYREELLVKEGFSFSKSQVQELVNDPADLVGAFTSQSIADIAYSNSPDVLARYIQVPPIAGPEGEKNAIMLDLEPRLGGMIPANSRNKKESFHIMDLMLSEEASLIAEFGEEGVDWRFSDDSDLSTYGNKAKITTIHYLSDKVQNQNFMGAGPQVIDEGYIDGVTWNGNNSDVEYIDLAVMSYEPYYLLKYPDMEHIPRKAFIKDTDKIISMFITGELDVTNDRAWNAFQKRMEAAEWKK